MTTTTATTTTARTRTTTKGQLWVGFAWPQEPPKSASDRQQDGALFREKRALPHPLSGSPERTTTSGRTTPLLRRQEARSAAALRPAFLPGSAAYRPAPFPVHLFLSSYSSWPRYARKASAYSIGTLLSRAHRSSVMPTSSSLPTCPRSSSRPSVHLGAYKKVGVPHNRAGHKMSPRSTKVSCEGRGRCLAPTATAPGRSV
jgi:hypothetical protein